MSEELTAAQRELISMAESLRKIGVALWTTNAIRGQEVERISERLRDFALFRLATPAPEEGR